MLACATTVGLASELPARTPHIALMLPLNSATFGRHADAVRQGFQSAAKLAGAQAPPIRIYAVNEDTTNVLTVYEQAVESGARLVVGPLTRSGVTTLARSNMITAPTLALNAPEGNTPSPPRMHSFGLNVESEARQIARLAFGDGRNRAFVVADNTTLSRRMRQAFVEEFARLGGLIVAEYAYSSDPATLSKLREATNLGVAESIFLALDHGQAVTVRPFLGNSLAIFATSQVNAARTTPGGRDLNRVRFVDMPWMLQADHPAVMVYPRPSLGDSADLDRLYALGIDAFRLGLELLQHSGSATLDGVTGRIRLNKDQSFSRELTAAQFVDGKTLIVSEPR